MSISTYAELQTAVAEWLHRSGLSARAPDFIQMGEAYLNRKLRTLDMEQIETLTASTSSRFLALPAGCIEVQSLYIDDDELAQVESSEFSRYVDADLSSEPRYYALKDQIEFDVFPDSAYSVECRYLKKYDIATDSSNWLLTNHPDLYLYASISSAAFYIKDDSRLSTVKGLLSEAIEDLNNSESRRKGSATMRVDAGISAPAGFDIIKG